MPFGLLKQKLIARGYWDEAGSGEGGQGAGGAAGDTGTGDTGAAGEGDSGDKGKQTQLSDKEAELLKDVMKQKQRAKEAESQILNLKSELSRFEGIDLDEVKALLNEKKTAEQKKLEEQGQWEALKKQMAEENAKIVKQHSDKAVELESVVKNQQKLIDELTLGSAFSGSEFIKNELELSSAKTRTLYGSHFELEEGKVVAYDKPRGEKDRVQLVDASGNSLSFDEAIRKLVSADPEGTRLMKVKAKQGAGSGTTNATKTDNSQTTQLTGMRKIEMALSQQKK